MYSGRWKPSRLDATVSRTPHAGVGRVRLAALMALAWCAGGCGSGETEASAEAVDLAELRVEAEAPEASSSGWEEPAGPLPLEAYEQIILGRDIFNAYEAPGEDDAEEDGLSALPLMLLGTIVGEPEDWSMVLLAQVDGRRQQEAEWFHIGETVFEDLVLAQVDQREAVLLGPDGSEERLRIGEGQVAEQVLARASSARKVSRKDLANAVERKGRRFTLDKEAFAAAQDRPGLLTSGAQGREAGDSLVMTRSPNGTVLRKLGIRKGDKVQKVGGQEVQNLGQLQEALGEAVQGDSFGIRLERQGRPIRYRYKVED